MKEKMEEIKREYKEKLFEELNYDIERWGYASLPDPYSDIGFNPIYDIAEELQTKYWRTGGGLYFQKELVKYGYKLVKENYELIEKDNELFCHLIATRKELIPFLKATYVITEKEDELEDLDYRYEDDDIFL
jgi:hypothetical protein